MEKSFICRLRDLSRAIETYSRLFEDSFGISLTQAVMLCQLREKPGSGPGELAAALGLTGSHASKQIAALESRQLIKRQLCKEDKRCMRFTVTPKGLQALSALESAQLPPPSGDVEKLLKSF